MNYRVGVMALAIGSCLSVSAHTSASANNNDEAFSACVKDLSERARAENISQNVIDEVLSQVQYVPRVIELDRRQPEFTQTFHDYFGLRINEQRIQTGRELLLQHQSLLQKLTREYGIPPQYLVAFWGMETNFGSYLGKMKVLDSLATLACDTRRGEYFTIELMQALRLVEKGVANHASMVGSWAGAMGNMQFMPSAYIQYGVDGDGDGVANLWKSIPDALTSAAYFLQQLGWQRELRWGREVLLPDGFDYAQTGRVNARPLREWASLGVKDVFKNPLPPLDLTASVLLPSGHKGPAFIVYDNFNVIMKWNRSEFYALSVGVLADQIKGVRGLRVEPPKTEPLSKAKVTEIQQALLDFGADVGVVDGVFGSKTTAGLQEFQRQRGLVADGFPDATTINSLLVKTQTQQ